MEVLQTVAQFASIVMPLAIIPLMNLSKALTEIKIDIAKLKQQTGVH